ncbi:LysR family transcriptional regulator [Microbaculum marinum]|uniref:LysR family transcriptional regulator n=1 Tax=Microbaculum marinum TaxID=1764581 RepID=A0AAW9RRL7_9HYPH
MRLDLQTLKLFVAVYEEQNLAKAAEREHLAASAVSKRLANLEQDLKVRIFERKRTGMYPTPAGEALISHARAILGRVSQLETEISDFSTGLRGNLRVFANTSAMVQYLPGDLRSFLARHPRVNVEIEETTSPLTVRAVADNEAEIGIFGDVVQAPGLHSMVYRHDRLCLLVPERHPLGNAESLRFAQALEHEFIGTPRGSSIDTAIMQAASDLNLAVKMRMRVAGFEAIGRMVEAELGVALVPEAVARSYVDIRRVRAIPLNESWVARRLMLCVRRLDTLSPPAKAFIDHLVGRKS